jgi:hypothetical protein
MASLPCPVKGFPQDGAGSAFRMNDTIANMDGKAAGAGKLAQNKLASAKIY